MKSFGKLALLAGSVGWLALVVACASPWPSASGARVELAGNQAIPSSELLELIQIDDWPTAEPGQADMLERDILALHAAYYDRGYLRAGIEAERRDTGIVFFVSEGKRFRLASLQIDEGNRGQLDSGHARRWRSMIDLDHGDWFDRTAISRGLERIRTQLRDAGHAHVQADPTVTLDDQRGLASVVVSIRPGPIVEIACVNVVGNHTLTASSVLRELGISARERFNYTKLEQGLNRLRSLGAFSRVDASTEDLAGRYDQLVVTVEVAERTDTAH